MDDVLLCEALQAVKHAAVKISYTTGHQAYNMHSFVTDAALAHAVHLPLPCRCIDIGSNVFLCDSCSLLCLQVLLIRTQLAMMGLSFPKAGIMRNVI